MTTSSTKGELSFVVILILFLLAAVMLFGIISLVAQVGRGATENAACLSSVRAHVLSGGSTPIICPTEVVKIRTKNQAKAKKAVADSMVACWNNYGKGELNLFSEVSQNFCEVCSVVEFDGPPIEDFASYLYTHRIRSSEAPYFLDYLSGKEVDPAEAQSYGGNEINTEVDYAIIFTYDKNAKEFLKGAIGAGSVGVFTGLSGAILAAKGGALIGTAAGPIGTAIGFAVGFVGGAVAGAVISQEPWGARLIGYVTDTSSEADPGILLVPYDTTTLTAVGCEELSAGQGNRQI